MPRALEQYLRAGVKGTPFCPGCGHGLLMGHILRAIDELKLDMNKMLFVSGIGCAAWIPSPHFAGDTSSQLSSSGPGSRASDWCSERGSRG